jgi:signal transduction histidine kinase
LHFYVYLRLIVLTAGTLLPFFWIVVILGHRRQRNFERIFFFLCLSMVCFFGASLLALNAQLYYSTIPPGLANFSWTVLCLGLWFLPTLLLHLHVEYAQVREMLRSGRRKWLWLVAAYGPAILLSPMLYGALRLRSGFSFLLPSNALGTSFQIWLVGALTMSAVWQWQFGRAAPDEEQKSFHRALCSNLGLIAVWMAMLHFVFPRLGRVTEQNAEVYITIVGLFALAPLVALIRNVQRFNFLQIGRQRNLIYAVFAAFVALLYFSLIRRVSLWLEPYVPPEATAAILLFLPVVLFEPLQRLVGRILRRTAHAEMDRTQRMMGPIQEVARLGDLARLKGFIEKWIGEQLQVAEVQLQLGASSEDIPGPAGSEEFFAIRQSGNVVGMLRVKAHGAMLSGETVAALEFLCEQLPGTLDLCRLIEEKLQLERELAERERLAALGQMAASISHNLKNPLGSMKTILQVQLENPEMPESMRAETKMILEEIGRLSAKLNQLLQFSRPAVLGEGRPAKCDATEVAREVVGVLRPEAQRKGVALELLPADAALHVAISTEALNDILTNLVVNALDAAPRGGHVQVEVSRKDGNGLVAVRDDGPGVAAELREKILQPFFTTKTQGTGLGLAIVARRASDAGGKLEFESPVKNGRGTRFYVTLPVEEKLK